MTNEELEEVKLTQERIGNMIYIVRGQRVMLDFELAKIYGYSTRDFNKQSKNNSERFDTDFCFKLTKSEWKDILRWNNSTSNYLSSKRRYLPYAFTEQGVYMLMTVLKGELAVKQSKALIRLFKNMKDYIIESHGLDRYGEILKLADKVNSHDMDIKNMKLRLEKVMENFVDPSAYKQFLILDGEKIEAASAYQYIYSLSKRSLIIFDDYISIKSLNLLLSVNSGVEVIIFSDNVSRNPVKQVNIDDFVKESGVSLTIKPSKNIFHDRLIIIDYNTPYEKIYISGASSKDAGNRITTIIMVDNKELYHPLIEKMVFDN